ncbi:conjugative transfer signal peptidase TraF [Hephaestia caeni]|uniref:Conjugative transfer signal peptidase TraF n=1 Tax=Hephaestia caeni TaxID=645617 RepID=A0A397PEB4_9SPHN|nr:S26 family signal peptidase [Hephaestia caeni]RIA46753.1 conjugative transfer signal peptidase TraF [Hephaestia caeni]
MSARASAAVLALAGPAFASMFVATALLSPHPRLVWNASASAPIGLYAIAVDGPFKSGDLVAIDTPEPLATFLARRRYLPRDVPLLKHIAGVPGQIVCRSRRTVTIDGKRIGDALARDRAGRVLPVWRGCHRIVAGEFLPMNARVRDSFDGRYFGVLPSGRIIGRAIPVWTDPHDTGRFAWRAPAR